MPCGLGGIVAKNKIGQEEAFAARNLLVELTRRGTDAYGWFNGHNIYKNPGDFEKSVDYYSFVPKVLEGPKTDKLLLHTRATTDGSPKVNKNNHPFEIDNLYMAHNGRFYTWDDFENPWGIETDSFAYLYWIWKKHKNRNVSVPEAINDGLNHVRGQYAIWLYDKDHDHIYLFRNISAIFTLFYHASREHFIFASERSMVKNAAEDLGYNVNYVRRINPGMIYRLRNLQLDRVKRFSPRQVSLYETRRRFQRGSTRRDDEDRYLQWRI